MSYIHVPPAFVNDPVIFGPLLEPTNDVQRVNYHSAIEAADLNAWYGADFHLSSAFAAHVGNNLSVSGRLVMPFSLVNSPADVIKPYALWQIFDYLIAVESDGNVGHPRLMPPYVGYNQRYDEDALRKALNEFRKRRLVAAHHLDILALDAAIAECLDEIDSTRTRQRKRREPR